MAKIVDVASPRKEAIHARLISILDIVCRFQYIVCSTMYGKTGWNIFFQQMCFKMPLVIVEFRTIDQTGRATPDLF